MPTRRLRRERLQKSTFFYLGEINVIFIKQRSDLPSWARPKSVGRNNIGLNVQMTITRFKMRVPRGVFARE
jgi:hypothetical protein